MSTRKKYPKAFKIEAVRQLTDGEKPVAVLARELGVLRKDLYRWKQELADKGEAEAFPGNGVRNRQQSSETAELRRRVAELEEENAILKKAAAYFAKEVG